LPTPLLTGQPPSNPEEVHLGSAERSPKNWVLRNWVSLALLGAWNCLVAMLFALHLTATTAGLGAIWLMGLGSSIVALTIREARERKLSATEARFRELFDKAPIAYHELDRMGVIQRVNRAECILLGYEECDLVGRPVMDFIAASDKEDARRKIGARLAGEHPDQPLRRRFSRRDGSVLTLEIHTSPVRDRDGAIAGLRSASLDITERLRAEEALRESEETSRAVGDAMLNALIMMDAEGRVTRWNPGAERIFGYTKAEMMGQALHDLLVPDEYRASFHANFTKFCETGTGPVVGKVRELRGIRKDGSEFPLEISLAGVRLRDQWHAVGVIQDITERKVAEAALAEEVRRRRTIFEYSRDGIVVFDQSGKVRESNKSFADMLGYSQEEMLQLHVWDWDAQLTRDQILEIMRDLASLPPTFQSRHKRKDGSLFDAEISAISLESGGDVSYYALTRDITERNRTEKEVRAQGGELTRSNAELKQELDSRRLVERELRAKEYSLSESQRIAHVGSWSWELPMGTALCAWTPETYRVFGVSPDTFVTSLDMFPTLIHPEDRASMQAWIGACLAGAEPPDLEFRAAALRDGGFRYVLGRGHLELDAENKPVRLVGIAQDITDRRRAEEDVRQANEKLSASVLKLENRAVREGVLAEMRTFLQACSSTQEIAPIVAHSMGRLFPGSDGALFLMSPSKTDLETTVKWGDYPKAQEEDAFYPDDCWALRRGCLHVVYDVKSGLICPHMRNQAATAYACMPLTAKGDVLGLLNLRSRQGAQPAEAAQTMADLEDMSSMLSELLSLSISNIRLSETLRTQSIKDPLTGLFNRRHMEECLQREIWRASRNGRQIGVVMADIDHFKTFNDTYGHGAGDFVLSAFGNLVNTQIRGSDIACRYGGEEFTLILPEATAQDAPWRANDLLEKVRALKLTYGDRELGPVTISMGVSTYPDAGATSDELLRAADAALYAAKLAGRDRVVVHGAGVLSPSHPRPEPLDPSIVHVLKGAA